MEPPPPPPRYRIHCDQQIMLETNIPRLLNIISKDPSFLSAVFVYNLWR